MSVSEIELFKIKNKLSDAEYEHLLLKKAIGENPLGWVKFPNNEKKFISK